MGWAAPELFQMGFSVKDIAAAVRLTVRRVQQLVHQSEALGLVELHVFHL